MTGYIYSAYGFTLECEFPCPELLDATGTPEVFLRYGYLTEPAPSSELAEQPGKIDNDCFLTHVNGVASYLVQHGNEIIVQPALDSLESDVRLWLFGSIFAALLNQRGMLALHASAIETPGGAILFAGPSGIGKSTLLLSFIRRGYPMLADDVSGIVLDGTGNPVVVPGIARTKLWSDALAHFGVAGDVFGPVRPGADKYGVPAHEHLARTPVPLNRIYVLGAGKEVALTRKRLSKLEGVQVILEQTYREYLLDFMEKRAPHLRTAAKVAKSASIFRVERPLSGLHVNKLTDMLEKHFPAPV